MARDTLAEQMMARQMSLARTGLERDAQRLAEEAQRLADDVRAGRTGSGLARQLVQEALSVALQASRLDALTEATNTLTEPQEH